MKNYRLKTICIAVLAAVIISFSGCSAKKASSVPPDVPANSSEKSGEIEKKDAEFRKMAESFDKKAEDAEENEDFSKGEPSTEEAQAETDNEEPAEINETSEEKTETPAAEEAPQPQESPEKPISNTCTITITCAEILDNMEKLDSSKNFSIPEGGIILGVTEIEFEDGASAFDILQKAAKENSIHMEFSKTPGTNSVYIEGIANIYEFDCGELSGWMYTVNGYMPMVSSSDYEVFDGDQIEFFYVCSFFEQ